jgi:hypothetical protein
MKIQDQVNLLGKAQEQLALLINSHEGIALALTILHVAEEKVGWCNEARHNAGFIRRLVGDEKAAA